MSQRAFKPLLIDLSMTQQISQNAIAISFQSPAVRGEARSFSCTLFRH